MSLCCKNLQQLLVLSTQTDEISRDTAYLIEKWLTILFSTLRGAGYFEFDLIVNKSRINVNQVKIPAHFVNELTLLYTHISKLTIDFAPILLKSSHTMLMQEFIKFIVIYVTPTHIIGLNHYTHIFLISL